MRKIVLSLFFGMLIFYVSSAQVATIMSYDGFSYSVGDTVQIGVPQYSSEQYTFILYMKTQYGANFYKKLPKEDFPLSYAVIEKIIPTEENEAFQYSEKSPLLEVRSIHNPDSILFINLDYAIAQKEIIRNPKSRVSGETPLETHTLLAFYHKIYKKEITDNLLIQYITSRNGELGRECEENAFKFQKIKGEWKAAFEEETANLDFGNVYFIEQPITHSEYDFEKSGYWISFDPRIYKQDKEVITVEPYYFRFQNLAKKNLLPMHPDIAEKFETTQKGIGYYSWLGTLYARIFFRFSKAPAVFPKTDTGIAMSVIYRDKLMDVEIDKVDVFDHDSYQYNYVGTVK